MLEDALEGVMIPYIPTLALIEGLPEVFLY